MKRILDITASLFGVIILSPLLVVVLLAVFFQDGRNPFYISSRVGKSNKPFRLIKVRSMIVNAAKSGVASTSADDARITKVGYFIRRFKIDELFQLFNVIIGSMSLVGPRPNVRSETNLYTDEERELLCVRPGITDFASIVFSDEGEILRGRDDADLAYNQLIRPWKSRLGLVYIRNASIGIDFYVIWLTCVSLISRERALRKISRLVHNLTNDELLEKTCLRNEQLTPYPPPGQDDVTRLR